LNDDKYINGVFDLLRFFMIVAFGALMSVRTGKEFYLTSALVWSLLNFIGVLALSKFLEGRGFDD